MNIKHKGLFFSIVYLAQFFRYFLVFIDLLFQPHFFGQYSIFSKSVKYVALLHIIVTYIKENKSDFTGCCLTNVERPITKLQKLYSLPRNLRAGNKLPAPFLEKPLCTGNLQPPRKISIERPDMKQIRKIWSSELYSNNKVIAHNTFAISIFGETSLHGQFIACMQNIH